MVTTSILLVGYGHMGSALVRGWIDYGIGNISILSPNKPETGVLAKCNNYYSSAEELRGEFDIIVFAVKPQVLDDVCLDLISTVTPETLILSIAAGKTTTSIAQQFEKSQAIVRTMPNLPASIGYGITVGVANEYCSDEQKNNTEKLMTAVGVFEWTDNEQHMDAVTALSGSGPAYLFHLIEVMTQAGIECGLSQELSAKLARSTVIGSSYLLEKEPTISASELRENVTSKGGTTEAALNVLMEGDSFEKLVAKAIKAAQNQSIKLRS